MDLSQLVVIKKNKTVRRVGRGTGSGRGKRSGRGQTGAGQRAGKKLPYVGFMGFNIPFFRKIPKRGFTSPSSKSYQIVNLKDIQRRLAEEKEITPGKMKAVRLINNELQPVKILGKVKESFSLSAVIVADCFSEKAKALVEQAGGKVQIQPCAQRQQQAKESLAAQAQE